MLRDEPHGREFSFHTTQFIDTWTVWPHSASRGWLTKITGSVAENAPARDEDPELAASIAYLKAALRFAGSGKCAARG